MELCEHVATESLRGVRCQVCVAELEAERDALLLRRDELLALVARVSRETPLPGEADELRRQVAALVAEVGTLRARIAELEAERPRRGRLMRKRQKVELVTPAERCVSCAVPRPPGANWPYLSDAAGDVCPDCERMLRLRRTR